MARLADRGVVAVDERHRGARPARPRRGPPGAARRRRRSPSGFSQTRACRPPGRRSASVHVEVVRRADVDDVDAVVGDQLLGAVVGRARRRGAARRPATARGVEAATPATVAAGGAGPRGRGRRRRTRSRDGGAQRRRPVSCASARTVPRTYAGCQAEVCMLSCGSLSFAAPILLYCTRHGPRRRCALRIRRRGAGASCSLIRGGRAVTRAALARETGLARSTVAQRVDALLARGAGLRGRRHRVDGRPAGPRGWRSTTGPASSWPPTSARPTRGWR